MTPQPSHLAAFQETGWSTSTLLRTDNSAAILRAAVWVIMAGTVMRLGLAALLDPGLDEAYAMAVATQWQLSWFDHPPMAFWWVKAMREIAGPFFGADVPVLVLRLPFVLAFTITSLVMLDLTHRRWGARAGLWMVLALSLAPFFVVSAGSWLVPDGPLVLFLSLTAWLLDRILFSEPTPAIERSLWLAAGLTLGLAGLSKYHAALFAVGAAVFILATPHRRHLLKPTAWGGVLLAGFVVSPVLVWNVQHDWVSFQFQSSRGLGSGGPDWSALARSVVGQMAYLGPWTLIAALAATIALPSARGTRAGPAAFLAALGLPSIILFTAVPLWGGDALPHWQMPGWLFLLPILGHAIASREARRRQPHRAARIFAVTAAAVLAVAIVAVALLRYAPPSSALIARFGLNTFLEESVTWRGLADTLFERGLLSASTPVITAHDRSLVVAFHWVEASRLAEALGSRATVSVLGNDPRGFAFLADQAAWIGRDVLFVGRPRTFARNLRSAAAHFTRIDRQPPVAVQIGDEVLFKAEVAIGRNLISPDPLPYPRR
ncbi:glycosyltransferase family 39 protein [Rhizobium halophilum]|uniref:glycosyltransferase family 39 protein n=1 Tax=Rhizobium halophilum TaxID=2846852 RepID=UPI001EFDEE92|nr:glycosyltransferase family 39 protein [Rhizobium halophilum]MCF6368144.1 glycosyltransferase family 39 protein [Rhizobium halophilum]